MRFILFRMDTYLHHSVKRWALPPLDYFPFFIRNQLILYFGVYFWTQFCYSNDICIQCVSILMSVPCYLNDYNCNKCWYQVVLVLHLCYFLKFVLAILGPLHFSVNFRSGMLISTWGGWKSLLEFLLRLCFRNIWVTH